MSEVEKRKRRKPIEKAVKFDRAKKKRDTKRTVKTVLL